MSKEREPLITHIFTADPSAHVFNGKIYIYPSHDVEHDVPDDDDGEQYIMEDYHVLSMDSLDAECIDNGLALSMHDVPWVSRQMWAPDAVCKNGRYYLVNVGDSRAYLITDGLYQLTKDHSYVQREVDMGRMTPEEALTSPRRNVLLQCVGASRVVKPDFFSDVYRPGQVYMQCSDGFRHAITPEEIYQELNPSVLTDEQTMKDKAVLLTERNKELRETDNITVLLVKVV